MTLTTRTAPKTIAEQVYDRVRDEVLTGALLPGVWIREQDLADALRVSRTPVREAIRRLAHDGLVEASPNRGVRVATLTADDVRDVYEVRELLEGSAAMRAANLATDSDIRLLENALSAIDDLPDEAAAAHIRADDAFHEAIFAISGSSTLRDLAARLNGRVMRVKIMTRDTNPSELTRVQHTAILRAIREHDPDAALSAIRDHVRTHGRLVVERLASAASP